jgi:D-arabinose 1-dehydrogenase-like Zn-dependent alcohol dehydrogenase
VTVDASRVLRLHAPAGPRAADLRVEPQSLATPAPDEVVVAVRACALGRLDRELVAGAVPAPRLPLVLGRELAGVVAAVGAEVADWQPGDRVAAVSVRPCHRCPACTSGRATLCRRRSRPGVDGDGGAATWARVSADDLVPLPLEVPFPAAAVATDTVAAAYHALKRAGVGDGVTLAVIGVGGLGGHVVQLVRLAGAVVVAVDVDERALEHAHQLGADLTVDARAGDPVTRVRQATDGLGVDRAVEATGTVVAAEQAIACLAPGGRAILLGQEPAPLTGPTLAHVVTEELEVAGSYGATPEDLGEVLDLVEAGRLDLATAVAATVGFEAAAAWLTDPTGPTGPGRVVLVPPA